MATKWQRQLPGRRMRCHQKARAMVPAAAMVLDWRQRWFWTGGQPVGARHAHRSAVEEGPVKQTDWR